MTIPFHKSKLIDARRHGPGSELFVVEGDSASRAVAGLRDPEIQAILPMQGKPLNAAKASPRAVRANVWYRALAEALAMDWNDRLAPLQFGRIVLLLDPDADGIHCGALLLLFFRRFLPELIADGRLLQIHPPLFQISADGYRDRLQAASEEHLQRIRAALDSRGIAHSHRRYRGLAGIDAGVLAAWCLDHRTRRQRVLTPTDAELAARFFGGSTGPDRNARPVE